MVLLLLLVACVPVVMFSDRKRPLPKIVGHLCLDDSWAMEDIARQCVKSGVRKVAHVLLMLSNEYADTLPRRRLGIASELKRKNPDLPEVL